MRPSGPNSLPNATPWRSIAALWLAFAFINASQIVGGMRAVGMHHAWARLFLVVLASWIVWPLATPLILRLGRRFPPTNWHSPRVWAAHFAACLAVATLYCVWTAGLQFVLQPWGSDAQVTKFWQTAFYVFYGEFHIFLILYAAILAIDFTFESARRLALILQPMVENAIEHGIRKRAAGGQLRVGATRNNGRLTLSVYNDGPQLPEDWQQQSTGIGLANVRARLKSLYGDSCSLDIHNHDHGVEVLLAVPYKAAES